MTKSAEQRFTCKVSYDVIGHYDKIIHKEETINTKGKKALLTYLRIKNRNLGLVRNVNYGEMIPA